MREIKFRSFYEVQGKYEPDYSNPLSPHLFWENLHRGIYDTDPEQYTGLKDKNGVDIYEGDILLIKKDNKFIYFDLIELVIWDSPSFRFQDNYIDLSTAVESYAATVLGNIHQNPELLDNN